MRPGKVRSLDRGGLHLRSSCEEEHVGVVQKPDYVRVLAQAEEARSRIMIRLRYDPDLDAEQFWAAVSKLYVLPHEPDCNGSASPTTRRIGRRGH